MLELEIWLACHFHIDFRWEIFPETIKSIIYQYIPKELVKPINIRISWSNEIGLREENMAVLVGDILYIDHIKNLNDKLCFHYYFHQERQYQFEHIKYIYDIVKNESNKEKNNEKWIIFCDDDDMFHPQRILHIYNTLIEYQKEAQKKVLLIDQSLAIYETTKYSDIIGGHPIITRIFST
jgi:hypothetical protein